jgi:hypothetical protein
MTASAIAEAIPAEGVPREIAIVAREPEENATVLMMIVACITGLVLIFEFEFHALSNGDGGEERDELEEGGAKGTCIRRRNPGTVPRAEVMGTALPWFVVRAQIPAGEEVSISLLTTALLLY